MATATELNNRVLFPDDKNVLNKRNEKDSISLTITHRPHAWPVHQQLSKSFCRFSSNEYINFHFYCICKFKAAKIKIGESVFAGQTEILTREEATVDVSTDEEALEDLGRNVDLYTFLIRTIQIANRSMTLGAV